MQVAGLPQIKGGILFGSGQIFTRDLNNFGPRVGSTYKLNEKTVLRGGYGLTYLPSITDHGPIFGFSVQTPVVSSIDAGRTPFATLPNPFPTGILAPSGRRKGLATALGQNITYNIHHRQIREYHQYSIGVQRELPWRSVVDISYVGSRTNKLGISRPTNDLNATQLALGDTVLNAVVANPFAGLMPDAPTRNGATLQQRELLRPYPQFGTISQQLVPMLIGDPVPATPPLTRWFNTCTLTAAGARQNCATADEPPAFQMLPANSRRLQGNRLEGVYGHEPLYIDGSVVKNIPLPNKAQLQLRAEAFNLTNVVQFAAPNATVTSAQFGTVGISQANDPRNIMVSVRVTF